MFSRPRALLVPFVHGRTVQLVRSAAHGNLPQGGQVLGREKVLKRLPGLALSVDLARPEPFHQLFRLNVHQFNLIGTVKYMVRNAFVYHHPCD